ncbi:toprim domain-containing protein [Solwaraspora sp. WMMD1047]|uniref:toprim domain-containing protein n=1 Tax=Solwaraspora sp. WMMD1047 TaxID=3016102 RepID=UPI002415D916|nr:toprim domain-containing protein [Solwaraspora sp. WMMD1047]MDG4833032.1 toprim domain-containing protein [Solwaraspora sp. WMMD1047]
MADRPVHAPSPAVERLYAANAEAARYYRRRIAASPAVLRYARQHGIAKVLAENEPWAVGYAPSPWTGLVDHIRGCGFTDPEIQGAGLAFVHRATGNLLDRFRDRIMFPVTDHQNRVVGFTARDLSGNARAKWINTPETPIYQKSKLLYGLGQQLVGRLPGEGTPDVVIVEGAADVLAVRLMANVRGAPAGTSPLYAVAPCGTHLTSGHLDLLHQALPGARLILAFDSDPAGERALDRTYLLTRRWPGQVLGTRLPAGHDPASRLATVGPLDALGELLAAALPLAQIAMSHVLQRLKDSGHITNPTAYAEDRVLAFRAVVDFFVDNPGLHRQLAADAARLLGLGEAEVARGIMDIILARSEADLPADGGSPEHASERKPRPRGGTSLLSAARNGSDQAGDTRTSVFAGAFSRGRQAIATTAAADRHDATTGVTAWALADGIGDPPEASAAATMACESAVTAALGTSAADALTAARSAVNAHYQAHPPDDAGDASLLIVIARPDPTARYGVHYEIAWTGDCRAYTVNGHGLHQLTTDHTTAARRQTEAGPSARPEGIADRILTSSIRTGPIGTCSLPNGPLLLCTATVHRQVGERLLATELASITDVLTSVQRIITAAANHHNDAETRLLLVLPRDAPSALVSPALGRRAKSRMPDLARSSYPQSPTAARARAHDEGAAGLLTRSPLPVRFRL